MDKYREFVKLKHGDQKRIQGTPYYLHPYEVSNILENKGYKGDYLLVALFHDLFEDTNTTEEEILFLSNDEVLSAVKLLTKEDNYDMENYVSRITSNELARVVKLADRLHNLTEAIYADNNFKKRYIEETLTWYIPLSKNTVFESDIKNALDILVGSI